MSDRSHRVTNLPPEQQAIRAKCFHPSGTFVEFPIEDVRDIDSGTVREDRADVRGSSCRQGGEEIADVR